MVLSSLIFGAAAGYFAWVMATVATCARTVDPALGRFETARRQQLRSASGIYRWFEPWIDEMVGGIGTGKSALTERLQRQLTAAAEPAPWRPAECIAVWRIEALMAAAAGAAFGWIIGGATIAAIFAVVAFFFYFTSKARSLGKRADRRRNRIKRQLAGAIDLIALMMEVGAGFQECLATVARRSQGTPLGDEFGRVLADIEAGRPRKEALRGFAERISDDDTSQLVFAIVQGEELGTPLTGILRNQSDQMRQKRSQWAEKASEEAQVTIVFPAMVIMLACLIVVAMPFVLASVMTQAH